MLVIQATTIGLAANSVNPDRLPWIRVPLRDTRRTASASEVLEPEPSTQKKRTTSADNREVTVRVDSPDPTSENAVRPTPIRSDEPSAATPRPELPSKVEPKIPSTSGKPRPGKVALTALPPALTDSTNAPVKTEALFTTLADAKALFDRQQAVFVDARHAEDYESEHIEGALSLFVDEADSRYEGVLGGVPKDRTIVTYCSDALCDSAIKLADALVARGHTRVFILLDGMPGWKSSGYPSRSGEAP